MTHNHLYSVVLELTVRNTAIIPATMGHQAHALFLDLIQQSDPVLSARLHDEPGYRPFTVSPLLGVRAQGEQLSLHPDQPCRLRVTLLDGGTLWQCMSARFLEAGPLLLRLGAAEFSVNRMLSTPAADKEGWAGFSTWPDLAVTPAQRHLTFRFATPTAFNLGNKRFALFPEPILLWDSFLRVWNGYAPEVLHIDKAAMREFVTQAVVVSDYDLGTVTLHYPAYTQKGFVGTCTYMVKDTGPYAAQLAALAAFARYAGAGYKTTMGMGQVRLETKPEQTTR